jgi:hypothetical protein
VLLTGALQAAHELPVPRMRPRQADHLHLRQSCFNCQKPEMQLCALSEVCFEELKNILFQAKEDNSNKKIKLKLENYVIPF